MQGLNTNWWIEDSVGVGILHFTLHNKSPRGVFMVKSLCTCDGDNMCENPLCVLEKMTKRSQKSYFFVLS